MAAKPSIALVKTADETPEQRKALAEAEPISEDVLAELWEDANAGLVLFEHNRGKWYKYDPASDTFRQDETERVLEGIRLFIRGRAATDKPRWRSYRTISSVEKLARTRSAIATTRDRLDADPYHLGTPAGVYDLRTLELLEPDPSRRVTKRTRIAPEQGPPERWLKFLDEATGGDGDLVQYLQAFAGSCLTGDTKDERVHFFWGPGGNGKGVFLGALTDILDEYAMTATMDTFLHSSHPQHTTDLAALCGARLVTASESAEGARWDEKRIKSVSGRDVITARFLFRDNFSYRPTFKVAFAANHKPRIPSVDEGWRRRLRMVPFDKTPANPDPDLKTKLIDEYPRILWWMLEGCEWWQREGLGTCEAIEEASKEYLESEDTLGLWFAERCIKDANAKAKPSELFSDYKSWCEGMGHGAGTQHKLTRYLSGHKFVQSKTEAGRPFKGIRLRSELELGMPGDGGNP